MRLQNVASRRVQSRLADATQQNDLLFPKYPLCLLLGTDSRPRYTATTLSSQPQRKGTERLPHAVREARTRMGWSFQ
jgi:hypothetical protein